MSMSGAGVLRGEALAPVPPASNRQGAHNYRTQSSACIEYTLIGMQDVSTGITACVFCALYTE